VERVSPRALTAFASLFHICFAYDVRCCLCASEPKMFATRAIPANDILIIYGDMTTQTAFSATCNCGQTPCNYLNGGTSAPTPTSTPLQ
jgi:hypothetical protein